MTNILRAFLVKVDSMQEQMDNVSRERKKQTKRNAKDKNTLIETNTAFDGIISKLYVAV